MSVTLLSDTGVDVNSSHSEYCISSPHVGELQAVDVGVNGNTSSLALRVDRVTDGVCTNNIDSQ
jgi:hypothetical protein